jgi:hypothetical protein
MGGRQRAAPPRSVMQVVTNSLLPDELRAQVYGLLAFGDGERIVATAIRSGSASALMVSWSD